MLLTLCDYAAAAPDGTINVVRGGIDRWETDIFPLQFQAFVLIQCARGELVRGEHQVTITVKNAAGEEAILGEGKIEVGDSNLPVRIPLPVGGRFKAPGRKTIEVRIGDQVAIESFEVLQRFPGAVVGAPEGKEVA